MMSAVRDTLLAVSASLSLSILLKVTITTAVALLIARIARSATAATRHFILASAFAALVVLPATAVTVPRIAVPWAAAPSVSQGVVAPSDHVTELPAEVETVRVRNDVEPIERPMISWVRMILSAWLIGAIACVVPIGIGLSRVRSLRRLGQPWPNGQQLLDTLVRQVGIRRHVDLVLFDPIHGPMTGGVRRPLIALPSDSVGWPDDDLQRALFHELEHIRRRDWLTRCVARTIAAVYWFHPLVWRAWRHLSLEAERACDDAVVFQADASLYARQLVALARRMSGAVKTPVVAMASRHDLRMRVEALLNDHQRRGRLTTRVRAAICSGVIIVLGLVSPLRIVATDERPGRNEQAQRLRSGQSGGGVSGAGQAGAAASPREFEQASVRPCDPNNLPEPPAGGRGGGANSFQMTPGRTYAQCMTLATLIRTAFGFGPMQLDFLNHGGIGPDRAGLSFNNAYGLGVEDGRRVRGGPDWVRSERYTIEAIADDRATAQEMTGTMLRALLEKRFQLKAHIETEQVPAFDLTIVKGGLKIKPVESSAANASGSDNVGVNNSGACEMPPSVGPGQPRIIRPAQPGERQPSSTPGQPVTILFRNFVDVRRGEKPTCGVSVQRNGPNSVVVGGAVTLEAIAKNLESALGGVTVFDKTGNSDKFNFILEYGRDENTPGLVSLQQAQAALALLQQEQAGPSDVPLGQTIFAALEKQLGLKLVPTKAPRDYIMIDRVERLRPN